MTDTVTTGELARRFDAHAKAVQDAFAEVKDDVHALDIWRKP